jgi:predicted methyltransferase
MLPRSAFDAVLISNAYHEMTEHQTMLAHIREALKPGGRLVVIESIDKTRRQSARAEQVKHHELSPELVESDLSAAGFQLVSRVEPLVPSADATVRYLVAAQPTQPQAERASGQTIEVGQAGRSSELTAKLLTGAPAPRQNRSAI